MFFPNLFLISRENRHRTVGEKEKKKKGGGYCYVRGAEAPKKNYCFAC